MDKHKCCRLIDDSPCGRDATFVDTVTGAYLCGYCKSPITCCPRSTRRQSDEIPVPFDLHTLAAGSGLTLTVTKIGMTTDAEIFWDVTDDYDPYPGQSSVVVHWHGAPNKQFWKLVREELQALR